jgi:AraC family transcriptional regulator of adaptative response / DNA-3-methyladenine glycosylase II
MQQLDDAARFRAVQSRDRRFDGVFFLGVRTTGIYCRPSCPARTPKRENILYFPSAAAAQTGGFRACRRCIPDATPGSPDWDVRADVAGRAMRLIADGVVEREGVTGLARRLGFSERQVERTLNAELGAGPLALARSRRAQTARILVESTSLSFADIAFAAGFSSIRQFNATMREVYAASPTELRGRRTRPETGRMTLRLAVRGPFAGDELLGFLAARAVPGVEVVGEGSYSRTLRLPHGYGAVTLEFPGRVPVGETAFVACRLVLEDVRDLGTAVERCRRLLDADADPSAVDAALSGDPVLGRLVRRRPGLRVPGQVDGFEVAARAVLGQQVSVAAARGLAGRITDLAGARWDGSGVPGLTSVFPGPEQVADLDPELLPMPRARARTLLAVAESVADGAVALDRSQPRAELRERLLSLRGLGPWTVGYIAMRALGDPDVFLPSDAGVRAALARLGVGATAVSDDWSPWRSYAVMHLWSSIADPTGSGKE